MKSNQHFRVGFLDFIIICQKICIIPPMQGKMEFQDEYMYLLW